MRLARAVTVASVLGFLLLTGVSALRYPGGTQADRTSEGRSACAAGARVASVAVLRGTPTRGGRVLTWTTLVAALLHFAHYVAELIGGPAYGAGVPLVQKVVTLVILLWLVTVALTSRERPPHG